jgi:hypothetical protein
VIMPEPQYLDLIERASEDYAEHERMTLPRILRWFDQFDKSDQHLAAKVLGAIDYYPSSRIRGMTRELVRLVLGQLDHCREDHIYFVPVGGVYESSRVIARALRDERREQASSWSICSMSDVEALDSSDVDAILFVDDFSGTADSLVTWWEEVEPLVLPKQAIVGISLLVLNHLARSPILEFADILLAVNELDLTYDALSEHSRYFAREEDRNLLHSYCEKTGASPDYIHGYGECGLLLAFKHGCPNNSLPILWWNSDHWDPLFQRYGI